MIRHGSDMLEQTWMKLVMMRFIFQVIGSVSTVTIKLHF